MTTTAEVTVTLRLTDLGAWSDKCTGAQIRDQATRAAMYRLNSALKDLQATVVGQPTIKAIVSDL